MPFEEYAQSLNRKRVAAGVVFRDGQQRVLMVETSYKTDWDIPGGAVEADEPPWTTARREVLEELGLDRSLGTLLVIDYIPTRGVMPEGMAFLWDGGVLTDDEQKSITLTDPEILSARFCTAEEIATRVRPEMGGRIAAALVALERGTLSLCEDGHLIS